MKLTKKVLYTLMVFACLSVFTFVSCNDEKTETTETTETTTPAEPAATTTTTTTTTTKDSVVAPAKMDTAAVKPVEAPVKK